jgi:methylmalonyl-CoA/ethylmalonyl-CoA epimerase
MTAATAAVPAPDRIGQIFIRVRQLDRAIAFYRDVLGLPFLFTAPPAMAFFACGGVRLLLGPAEDARFDHPASIIYYAVQDIEATAAALERRGAVFERAPHLVHRAAGMELWIGFLQDSEGNTLAIMEEKRTA